MENIIKKIKKGAKHTRLSAIEKAEMRNVLVRHVKVNPVDSAVLNARGIPSPFNINNFRNKKGISILVIVGLLMGGTVSFAAESTVPGDALFTVKVHVNENVRGVVSVTSKAKAEWEVKLVERRLEEVEKLAMAPDVTPEVQQIAEQNLERYTERVKNRIEKFDDDEDDEDAMEVASNLSEVFNVHEQVLLAMNVPATTTTTVVIATSAPVAVVPSVSNESIKGTLKKVQGARGDAEKKHKELKEKYRKEKIEKEEKVTTEALQNEEPRTKPSKSRVENRDRKQKDERKEQIRSTVTTEQDTSTPSVSETPEPKKEENKKIEEIRKDEEKEDDHD